MRRGHTRRMAVALIILITGIALHGSALMDVQAAVENDIAAGASAKLLVPPTRLGINLFGLAPFYQQQVFTNLIAQSEWMSNTGAGWNAMPADQLDDRGWIKQLMPGQIAPRRLSLPARPFSKVGVRCTFKGDGDLSAGGIAHLMTSAPGIMDIDLVSTGADNEIAWIQLDRTNPANPVRQIDCRDPRLPAGDLFAPEFLKTLAGFSTVRFLDWQLTNLNLKNDWNYRTRVEDSSQVTGDGVAIENMVRLANEARVDPWFLMPYNADDIYIEKFARTVHDQLDPRRTVYIELGNEVWNDLFESTQQARNEGLSAGLAPANDPGNAQVRRYAQKVRNTMRIWTRVFGDRPNKLVRVAATINVNPDFVRTILSFEDMPRWIDALATAPYIHLDLAGRGAADTDWVFAQMDGAIKETIDAAAKNKAVAAEYGKRYISYEGGQHLITSDLDLAKKVQRDPRMAVVYQHYLAAWKTRIGDQLTLYASTSPISEAGAWGLREYAGQPEAETPKLRAVQAFLAARR
jgi:hypothetical protein